MSGEFTSLPQLFDPRHIADPYPTYARLRAEHPVWQALDPLFVLTTYANAVAVLRDSRFGHAEGDQIRRPSEARGGPATREQPPQVRSFLALNPPDHTRLRRLVSRVFTPSRVDEMTPRIKQITESLIARAARGDTVDVIEAVAGPLPVIVISELLGIPEQDRERLVVWSHALARGLDPAFLLPPGVRAAQATARAEFREYLLHLAGKRRLESGEDLISALVSVQDEGDVLSEEELVSTCILLLIAGHETTTSLIGNGLLALLGHPAQLARLREDRQLIRRGVEELLRYDSPVQLTARVALTDAEIAGTPVPRGSFVLILIGAANRDPDAFANPDDLDVSREPTRHLAFGQGIHFCLGAPLARIEAEIALGALLEPDRNIELAGDPSWKENAVLRGVASLPLRIT
jgi:cytochrome P450